MFRSPRSIRLVCALASCLPMLALAHAGSGEGVAADWALAAEAQDAMRAHQGQIRARQMRLRDRRSPVVAQFTSGVTLSDAQASVPLRLQDRPLPRKQVAPSPYGRFNVFARGTLHSGEGPESGAGLSTNDLTLGADYAPSADATIGLAVGRLASRSAVGTTVSTYLTMRPADRLVVDLSVSIAQHQTRSWAPSAGDGPDSASHGLSLTLHHPREVAGWTWSPYGRVDRVVTEDRSSDRALPTRDLSAVAIGSRSETTWTTPLGTVRPTVQVELLHESISLGSSQASIEQTSGTVGVGMATRLSRDMSAFAESRYIQSNTEPDRQFVVGVKLAFR